MFQQRYSVERIQKLFKRLEIFSNLSGGVCFAVAEDITFKFAKKYLYFLPQPQHCCFIKYGIQQRLKKTNKDIKVFVDGKKLWGVEDRKKQIASYF